MGEKERTGEKQNIERIALLKLVMTGKKNSLSREKKIVYANNNLLLIKYKANVARITF